MMCRRLHFGQVNRLLTFFFIFIVFNPIDRSWALPDQRQENSVTTKYAVIGRNVSILCETTTSIPFQWRKNGVNITDTDKRIKSTVIDNDEQANIKYNLTIVNVIESDAGNYTCEQLSSVDAETKPIRRDFNLQTISLPHVVGQSPIQVRTKISQSVQLFCVIEAHPITDYLNVIKWIKDVNQLRLPKSKQPKQPEIQVKDDQTWMQNRTKIQQLDKRRLNITLDIVNVFKKDNGTYSCVVESPYDRSLVEELENNGRAQAATSVLVLDVPQVSIDFVKAVGANQIFLNWTINDGNSPIKQYFVQFMKEGATTFQYYNHAIDGRNHSYVLSNFEPDSNYKLKITANNQLGSGSPHTFPQWIRTLKKDPIFVTEIGVKGNTHSTITIGWQPPPSDLLEYIHYYELAVAESKDNGSIIEEAIHPQNSRNLPYMFDNLKTATEYVFRVRACSELTKLCGNWSSSVTGTTMDGQSTAPINLQIECNYYNLSGRTAVSAQWEAPSTPNGKILSYHVVLNGVAMYRLEKGILRNETYGPKVKSVNESPQRAEYDNVPLNTNYTLRVSGVTRSKRPGDFASATCVMPRAPPDIGSILWGKIPSERENAILKLYMPRLTERNGPICGYRVYLVRLPSGVSANEKLLPSIDELALGTYHEIHAANNTQGGAYIAETFSQSTFQSEIDLGDGHSVKDEPSIDSFPDVQNEECRKLLNGHFVHRSPKKVVDDDLFDDADVEQKPANVAESNEIKNQTSNAGKLRRRRRRRHNISPNAIQIENTENGKATTSLPQLAKDEDGIQIATNNNEEIVNRPVYDGPLDPNSNYTGFIEVIVNIDDKSKIVSAFSEYFEILSGGPTENESNDENIRQVLNLITQVLCGLILLVLVLLTALCVLHRFNTKKHAGQGHDVISLRDSLSRAFCGGRNGQNHRHLIGSANTKPTDIGPIHRSELTQAYVQRHKDTDYGFLREYEMLPHRFNDRTTKNSDAKENSNKNRYPDIKAYDQTRVKLSERTTNGMTTGADYINANFVLGYKERKKFICAQGPMDATINDFWRMIWEQHLEIIVMLTNLEEYNKAKCAKYWPEEVNDVTKFGEITVKFVHEQRYSDYLVRELKVTRSIANNTAALTNGNGNNSNGGGSSGGEEEDERHITQYHYLAWKDFMAPELGVIRFIRQINEVYSVQRGPILVHCSAGVGRTGTLVALDSLMQQLQDENQVSIFNTVYDLRHQRNFLVQSLKQYIFLYRALLEVASFGNTEIHLKDLNSTVEQLKQRIADSRDQCKLEIEFEKIKAAVDETNKNCTVGASEENRSKNRSENIIPYDRNRVILTPIGATPSTYINATFIEGYDNSESFIVTQDPLEETIGDFWRMISEQSVSTIVMISEIGDGPRKCPRYWADDEIEYEHILVKYMQSESCPYYTRREFNVTNFKMKDTIKVTQFQYNGWPTVEGEVPEVSRGMLELVDQTQLAHNSNNFAHSGPIVVHCSLGTERSSIFVTLCILVQQLRLEKKVDICTIVRKLRAQRNQFFNSYAQYEFVHRAIANYADLHKSDLDSSPSPSVRTSS